MFYTDNEDPTFENTVSDVTHNTDDNQPYATVTWSEPSASDNSGSVSLTSDYSSGDTFPIGGASVTYTATDPTGNTATFSFTLEITGKFVYELSTLENLYYISIKDFVSLKYLFLSHHMLYADNESPTFENTVSNITQNTDANQPHATVTWSEPSASDNSGSVTLTSDYSSGDTFPIGGTSVTYTATDPSGNTATFSITVGITGKHVNRYCSNMRK